MLFLPGAEDGGEDGGVMFMSDISLWRESTLGFSGLRFMMMLSFFLSFFL